MFCQGRRSNLICQAALLLAFLLAPNLWAAAQADTGPPQITFSRAADIAGDPVVMLSRPRLKAGAAASLARPGTGSATTWPVYSPLAAYALTSNFGGRWHPILGEYRNHLGIDMAAPAGSPVYATASGIVRFAQWNGGYGLFVVLDHGGGLMTRYGHLERILVTAGQTVRAGDLLAYVGSTGLSTGPHLHYEIWLNGAAIDPKRYLRTR